MLERVFEPGLSDPSPAVVPGRGSSHSDGDLFRGAGIVMVTLKIDLFRPVTHCKTHRRTQIGAERIFLRVPTALNACLANLYTISVR